MNAQRIFMSVRATGTTDIVAQITVPQTTADYGVLIPVPDEPTLDSEPVSADDLNALDDATAPLITKYTGNPEGGISCGCGAAGDEEVTKGGNRGVTVSDQVTIGPVQAVSLTADSGDAVRAWLTDNGFLLADADTATFDRYVGNGRYFIAIRRADGASSGGPSSIGVHYTLPGDHRMLSLGFTRIGAASWLAFTLFLAAPKVIGPSEPFKAITLNELSAVNLREVSYAYAIQSAVEVRNSKAFVLESATAIADIAPAVPGLARFIDSGATVTRATTTIAREKIDEDVVFATPFTADVPAQRYVSLDNSSVRYAGMGALPLVLLARALRRRSRPRKC